MSGCDALSFAVPADDSLSMPREPHAHPDASASLSLTRRTSFAKLLDFAVIFGGAIFGLWMCAGCSKPENPTPPAERVAQAWEAFRQTEYDEATKRFQSIQSETSKESDRHIEALYGEAACAHHRQSACSKKTVGETGFR